MRLQAGRVWGEGQAGKWPAVNHPGRERGSMAIVSKFSRSHTHKTSGAHILAYVLLCMVTYALAQFYCGYYKAKAKITLGGKLKMRIKRSSEILFPLPSGLSSGAGRSGTWCWARINVLHDRSALPFQSFSRKQVWAWAQCVSMCREGCVQMQWGQQVLTVVSGKYLGWKAEESHPTPVGRKRCPRRIMWVPRSPETCLKSHRLRQDTDPGLADCGARLSL